MGMIYHYCSPFVFKSVVENKKLWLSATNNMNDFTEGDWFTAALHSVIKSYSDSDASESLALLWDIYVRSNTIKYATCFSKSSDVLSQWRAYAQNGEGVAIGFDEVKLKLKKGVPHNHPLPSESVKICEIAYMNEIELQSYIKFEISEAMKKTDRNSAMLEVSSKFVAMAMITKNPAFIEEDETRIIYSPLVMTKIATNETEIPNAISPIKFRLAGSSLTTYFEFDISKLGAISEVVLGPRNTFSSYDIELFLSINGLPKASISKSKATYR